MPKKLAEYAQNAHLDKAFPYNVVPECQMVLPQIASHARPTRPTQMVMTHPTASHAMTVGQKQCCNNVLHGKTASVAPALLDISWNLLLMNVSNATFAAMLFQQVTDFRNARILGCLRTSNVEKLMRMTNARKRPQFYQETEVNLPLLYPQLYHHCQKGQLPLHLQMHLYL